MTRRPEWIAARKAIPAKVKAEAWEQADGRCQGCGITCHGDDFHYDHVQPVALGGENTTDNVQILCFQCHAVKTAQDIAAIAKADRMAARAGQQARRKKRGTGQIKSAGFKTNRKSQWKRKLDGSIVKRES